MVKIRLNIIFPQEFIYSIGSIFTESSRVIPGLNIISNSKTTVDEAPATLHSYAMLIYKIFRSDEWSELQANGKTAGAPIDLEDGYIHFSTATQAQETADKHFAGAENLFVAAIDSDVIETDLKWEVSRGGAEFPHLYAMLKLSSVAWCVALPLVEGRHEFPGTMV